MRNPTIFGTFERKEYTKCDDFSEYEYELIEENMKNSED